jgi:3-oxoacyl-[acyl-carrier protein] reductase
MHVMDLGLTGQACVVTGASRGIGRAVARLLAAEGASVLLVARSGDALEEARAEARGSAEALALDITERGAAARVVEECESRFGGVDALVNNAGTSEAKPLDEL